MALFLVIGPPAAGKSTWVRQHAQPGDVTIDYDALACTLAVPGPDPHDHPDHVKQVTKAARQAAIDTALTLSTTHNVYVIHSTPSATLLAHYQRHGAQVITIDPGYDTVMARAKADRPWRIQQAVKKWYRDHDDNADDDDTPTEHPDLEHVVDRLDPDGRPRSRRYKKLKADFRNQCEQANAVCWLPDCQRPIDYTLRSPHPDSFSVDHAIPVAERPDLAEDPANFRPSHLDCNKRRGTDDPTTADLGQPSEQW